MLPPLPHHAAAHPLLTDASFLAAALFTLTGPRSLPLPVVPVGALEEVDWLRTKLEALEAALLSGTLDKGLLAALDGGLGGAAEVLKAAQAAVAGADGGGGPDAATGSPSAAAGQDLLVSLWQGSADYNLTSSGVLPGMDVVDDNDGTAADDATADAAPEQSAATQPVGGKLINDFGPLASQLAAAAESATCAADRAVAEAVALAAALATAEAKRAAGRGSASSDAASDAAAAVAEQEGGLAPALASTLQALPAKAPLIDRYLLAGPSELGEAVAAPLGSGSAACGPAEAALLAGATATVVVSLSRPASAKAAATAAAAEEDAALNDTALLG